MKHLNFIAFFFIYAGTLIHAQSEVLDNFSIDQTNGKVLLRWSIKSGNTCNGIEIYRSTDSITFQEIGDIQGTCGSSNYSVSYEFTDQEPIKNSKSYYRIKLGGNGYSQILSIEVIDVSSNQYLLRPNPITETGRIYFQNSNNSEFIFYVSDLMGNIVYSETIHSDFIEIKTDTFEPGHYLFIIQSTSKNITIKGKFQIL